MTDLKEIASALRSDRLSYSSLTDGSGVILDMGGLQILTLNSTGSFLVQSLLAGNVDEAGLLESLMAEFEIDEIRAGADVQEFLERLWNHLGLNGR